jgi:hypothetical protein
VEKCGILVDDAPFLAVELRIIAARERGFYFVPRPPRRSFAGRGSATPGQDTGAETSTATDSSAPAPRTRFKGWRASYVRAVTLCCRRSQAGRNHAKGLYTSDPTRRMGSPYSARRREGADLAPIVKELQASGVTSLRGIAKALNERRIPTVAGSGRWYHVQVARVLARLPA